MPDLPKVQGIEPGSINEYNVAMALSQLKLQYQFQVPIGGGHFLRGGQVVDFVVFRGGKPIPLFVHGRYWHSGARATDDDLKMAQLEEETKGYWDKPVIIWEEDCETVESARDAILKQIGAG